MLGMSTALTVVFSLSAYAPLTVDAPDQQSLVNSETAIALAEDVGTIPRFIITDKHINWLAAAIELGEPTRDARDIASIDDGCPGTGLLQATFSGPDINMTATGLPPTVFSLFVYGPPMGNPLPFYDGHLCAHWGLLQRSHVSLTTVTGVTNFTGMIQPNTGADVVSVQCIYRNPGGFYGGNLTNGLVVAFVPLP